LEEFTDTFEMDLIEKGEKLMKSVSEEKRKKWCDLLTEVDMRRSCQKAWNLLKRVDSNSKEKLKIPIQISHHLLMNGKNKLSKPSPCKPRVIRTENNKKHKNWKDGLRTCSCHI